MRLALVLTAPLALLGCASAPPSVEVAAPAATVEVRNQSPFLLHVSSAGDDRAYVYVLNATDPQKPHLAVYAFQQGRELELRAARSLEHDDLFPMFESKGKALSPADIKKMWDRSSRKAD